MDRDPFPCDQCGECCRHVSGVMPSVNNTCIYLDGNVCSIYDHRPEICNVERSYDAVCGMMTWDEWVDANINACKQLKGGNDGR